MSASLHPPGTMAYEFQSTLDEPPRSSFTGMPRAQQSVKQVEVQVRKPSGY
ncbi:hypothetical protein [Cupriavidus consociatus]|uniref:hypothetical protein n=1 Tax=Cupriavidus consociatus TaxID=2821357 RepID=UPI001AE0FE6F|nr:MULTISPECIES: hypothetical protein [unclassified Cupriavidus]MBP0625087.1 hypothetical protein [Cupriavidus sp. LEh25]MDK2661823.1 hypothetical protein [Cupriavidus sp. LEh21]